MRRNSDDDWYACPHCGAELATTATFCRECGSSSDSGWSDETVDDYVEEGFGGDAYFEDDEFDYDEYVQREFPDATDTPINVSVGKLLIGVIVALTCLALLLAAVL